MNSYFDCMHFNFKGQEFEVRVHNENDDIPEGKLRLEVWTVEYNNGELVGLGDIVKETILLDGLKIIGEDNQWNKILSKKA